METVKLILDILVHLDKYLDQLINNFGNISYFILALVVFCETGLVVTPFLPGDSLLFGIGALAAKGMLDVKLLFAILVVAVIAGDNVNYTIGRFLGPKVFQYKSRLFNREHLNRAHRFYEKHGSITIVLARFIPIIRTFSPFVAGIGKMHYPKFLFYSVTGGLFWITIFLIGGYIFGNLSFVKHNFSLIIVAIVLVSLLPAVIGIMRERRGNKK